MKRLVEDFLTLLFPLSCLLCKGPRVQAESFICSYCLLRLPRERNYDGTDNDTANRLRGMFNFRSAHSFLRFSKKGLVQRIIHQAKYKGRQQLAFQLGVWFGAEMLMGAKDQWDLIVPVPLHPEKLKVRGYNQSESIAEGIATVTGHQVKNLLKRRGEAGTQTKLSRWDRFDNTENEFILIDKNTIKGSRILLLDDIITTGATITGSALPLIDGGVGSLVLGALALTQNE